MALRSGWGCCPSRLCGWSSGWGGCVIHDRGGEGGRLHSERIKKQTQHPRCAGKPGSACGATRAHTGCEWLCQPQTPRPQAGNGWRGWKGMGGAATTLRALQGLCVPTLHRSGGAGCAPLIQDRGCWMCPLYSELGVLDVLPFHRIVSAGCALLVQDCGCWICHPCTGLWVL